MLGTHRTRISLVLLATLLIPAASSSISANDAQVSLQARDRAVTASRGEEASQRSPGSGEIVLSLDDGSAEQALGVVNTQPPITNGSQAVFLNRFTIDPSILPFTIDSVSILFPTSTAAGSTGLRAGSFFELLIFVDPTGSGNPANTVKKVQQAFSLQPSNSQFQEILLGLPIVIQSGDVWIGFTNTVTASDNLPIFPGAIDTGSSAGRSWAFFNNTIGSHFNGPLDTAQVQTVLTGNWLIRATGQNGGLTCLRWNAPAASRGAPNPPPTGAGQCGSIPPLGRPDTDAERGTGTLLGYNIYRASQPGVQTTPANFYASTPPTQTSIGTSVSTSGSFFVVTAVYDTGESGPSNEVAYVPPTIASVKVKPTKLVINGASITADGVSIFLDGIPFLSAPSLKKNNTRIVQKGTLVTGQTIDQYMTANGNSAKLIVRNSNGALASQQISR